MSSSFNYSCLLGSASMTPNSSYTQSYGDHMTMSQTTLYATDLDTIKSQVIGPDTDIDDFDRIYRRAAVHQQRTKATVIEATVMSIMLLFVLALTGSIVFRVVLPVKGHPMPMETKWKGVWLVLVATYLLMLPLLVAWNIRGFDTLAGWGLCDTNDGHFCKRSKCKQHQRQREEHRAQIEARKVVV